VHAQEPAVGARRPAAVAQKHRRQAETAAVLRPPGGATEKAERYSSGAGGSDAVRLGAGRGGDRKLSGGAAMEAPSVPAVSTAGTAGRAPIKGILKKGGGKQPAGGAGSGARQASPARDDDEHG